LSFFEVLTLAALVLFEEAALDVIVVEAGLGGRLDATRLVQAKAVVVTSIDLDHQQWLGDTLEEIAAEKAGVFRRDVPVFVGPVAPNVEAVLRGCAQASRSPYRPVLPLAAAPPQLPGRHQRANAALALAAVATLVPSVVEEDLASVRWPGRLERIEVGQGEVWLDVGHNPAAIDTVVETLRERLDPATTLVVFGCTRDRPIDAMMSHLSVLGPTWWVSVEDGTPTACERGFTGPDDAALLSALYERVARGDSILVIGSHRLVGPLRQWTVGHDTHIDPTDPRHAAL
jgi:dihydrofolate synthase/folylpolyglutamate synthase